MRGTIRPSRPVAILGMIGSLLVTFVGLGMMSDSGSLGPPAGFRFMWVVIGLGSAGVNAYWAFAERPQGFYDVDVEPEPRAMKQSAGLRLRELEQLRSDGLISDEEYDRKRTELLREL